MKILMDIAVPEILRSLADEYGIMDIFESEKDWYTREDNPDALYYTEKDGSDPIELVGDKYEVFKAFITLIKFMPDQTENHIIREGEDTDAEEVQDS